MRNTMMNQMLENAIKTWVLESEVGFDHAVTLTSPYEFRTRQHASRVLKYFLKRLNHRVLKNRYTREGEAVAIFPTIESKNRRMHFHAAMRCPQHVAPEAFKQAIKECWKAAHKGAQFAITDVQPMRNIEWIGYICKETTLGNIDAVDVDNICWGERSGSKHRC